jgi:TPR repeat protein
MKARSLSLWVALLIVVLAPGAWAQSYDAATAQYIAALKKKAANGDAKAQYDLGTAYVTLGAKDEEVAYWDRKAAEQGYAKAQADLGM